MKMLQKSLDDLKAIRRAGLDRLHLGLESGDDTVLTAAEPLRELRLTMQELSITGRVCFDHAGNYWKNRRGRHLFTHSYEGYKFPEEKQTVLDLIDEGLKTGNRRTGMPT